MLSRKNSIYGLLLVAGLLLIRFNPVAAQNATKTFLADAKVWKGPGDTIRNMLIYINQYNCQFNISLTDTITGTTTLYSPKDIQGFSYIIQDETVEYTSMPNPTDLGKIFLRVLYRGTYTLYQFLEINYNTPALSFDVYYFLWKDEWINPPLTQKFERESLLSHFSDCPELEYKIKTGEYGLSKIRNIMTEYEDCKLTDEYEFFFE
jgi:hypothetical protein